MTQRIQLLPDKVANQIAAGEVIQRPASVIKELVENAIDAGAKNIEVIIKDAGKSLIQVIDDGSGMSEIDVRMAFERHATSKINEARDLFSLNTKGFRGEALASIAAIAHVVLKSRLAENELGTELRIEGSKVVKQDMCQCPVGSDFSVRNLFYNVPARRKFLKSDPVEFKHIVEEFNRVAFAHPECSFKLFHNELEVYNLPISNYRQRISKVFGGNFNSRLVPVQEKTDIVEITGFVGKPEFARKTRGEQYLFANDRFIKSGYFHHAIKGAYDNLISKDHHPSYFLYFKVNPDLVDVNIHPTKTEIKFRDEKAIYAILLAAVKRSIGKYNISPSLDFEREMSLDIPELKKGQAIRIPEIKLNPNYNPFQTGNKDFEKEVIPAQYEKEHATNWQELYAINKEIEPIESEEIDFADKGSNLFKGIQIHKKYILTSIKSGFVFINQQRAHERVLFELYLKQINQASGQSQQSLFPEAIDLPAGDFALVNAHLDLLKSIGLDLEQFGPSTFKINGIPSLAKEENPSTLMESFLEKLKMFEALPKLSFEEKVARSMSNSHGIKNGTPLEVSEMQYLIEQLFSCENPYLSPSGLPIIVNFSLEELDEKFEK
ncbi:MAG: DNA mismatch repair endonuclease MutL [Bacteroidota bacterium]